MSTVAKDSPWAVVLCKWQDVAAEPFPRSYYENLFSTPGIGFNNMVDYFRLYTHGNLDLSASQVFGWFPLPHVRSEYTGSGANNAGRQQLIDWASSAATAGGVDLSQFFGVVVCMNDSTDLFGDQGYPRMVCDSGSMHPSPIAQEMLHGYNVFHSRIDGSPDDYRDQYDVMSVFNAFMARDPNFAQIGPGLNAAIMDSRGWLDPDRVWVYSGDAAEVSLRPHHRRDLSGYLVAKVGPFYVEFRMNEGWDAAIVDDSGITPSPVVLVHRFDPDGHSYLMATTIGGHALLEGSVFKGTAAAGVQYAVAVRQIDSANRTATITVSLEGGVLVPDLMDLSLRDARQAVQALGLVLRSHGVGDVIGQSPAAGVPVRVGTTVTVWLSNR